MSQHERTQYSGRPVSDLQAATAAPSAVDMVLNELASLNGRLEAYAAQFGEIADRWFGLPAPLPGKPSDYPPGAPAGPVKVDGKLAQLEQLLRVAHAGAQSIENQLDRLRHL